jgi:hypothetical protein
MVVAQLLVCSFYFQCIREANNGRSDESSKSSTAAIAVENAFNITYLDETGASGDYILDTLTISGATIPALQMGLAYKSTIGSGLMGIGYSENVASHSRYNVVPSFIYPNIIEKMLSSNVISRKAYSLYLNDLSASTGSIIFGGMDTAKYHGSLLQLPVVPTRYPNGTTIFAELSVVMTSVGVTGQQGDVVNFTTAGHKEPVLLDSGTTFSYLQSGVVESIYQGLNVIDDTDQTGLALIDCAILANSPKLTVDYGFGGADGLILRVPVDELVFNLYTLLNVTEDDLPYTGFGSTCGFGIYTSDDDDISLLGDSFLRSAYVVYDLESNQIALGQTNFNSTTSNVIEFVANATRIPEVSGVATSAEITQTSIGGLPGVGTNPTANQTPNPSATGSGRRSTTAAPAATSSSAAAAAYSIPPLDTTAFNLLGLSLAFVVMGGGFFIS